MSSGAYGGDEVGAVVIDLGSNSVRAGFAGEDAPKVDFPTQVGVRNLDNVMETDEKKAVKPYVLGTNNLLGAKASVEIDTPLRNGMIDNWDMFEAVIDSTFSDFLQCDISHHPILMSEPALNERSKREKLAEMMFEKYGIPAFFVCKSPVLSAFASGRSTGVVLDSGHTHTTATPVHDGYVLQKSVVKSPLGGECVLNECMKLLQEKGIEVIPPYMVKNKEEVKPGAAAVWEKRANIPEVTESWHRFQVNNILKDFSATVPQVADNELNDQDLNVSLPKKPYYFPNGYNYEFGTERMQVVEQLFNTSRVRGATNSSMLGVSHTVASCINMCDVDLRPGLYSSVIVTGGNTLLQGFTERLTSDLTRKTPPSMRLKVIASPNSIERRFSPWIGGSILASLGTFQQVWISKLEYEECGKVIVDRKCP